MRFTKMHGLGNDYVYVDGFSQAVDARRSWRVRIFGPPSAAWAATG